LLPLLLLLLFDDFWTLSNSVDDDGNGNGGGGAGNDGRGIGGAVAIMPELLL
jgi:hypothetical protein